MRYDDFRDRFFERTPRYEWRSTLGRGGMGIVYLAHDRDLDEDVAIKVLLPQDPEGDNTDLQRLKREITLNRKVKHPNIARIHEFGLNGDYPFLTMEYVPGVDLNRLIQKRGRLPALEAVAILRQIALGTQAAHQMGIIHRDLKPSNVIVGEGGAVVVLDFGLARTAASSSLTLASMVVGTPEFISPEQAEGKEAGASSDIYGIGVIAFQALTGRAPFRGESPMATAMLHVHAPVPEDRLVEAGVSAELRAVVLKALAKRPEERFASAADLERALWQIQAGSLGPVEPPPAPPVPVVPIARVAQAARPAPAPLQEGPPTLVRRRAPLVLVVEDEAAERALFVSTLLGAGCDTLEATGGQEALGLLMSPPPPDLLIIDLTLPGMDGFDLTRIVRSQPTLATLPIIVTSPAIRRNQFAFGIQAGATDFITKPISPETLAWRVWKLLKQHGFQHPAEREMARGAARAKLDGAPPKPR